MKRSRWLLLAAVATAPLVLGACGGHGGRGSASAPPPAARLEDSFGTNFGVDYRASANTEPVTPAAGDIVPLSLTTEPTALH